MLNLRVRMENLSYHLKKQDPKKPASIIIIAVFSLLTFLTTVGMANNAINLSSKAGFLINSDSDKIDLNQSPTPTSEEKSVSEIPQVEGYRVSGQVLSFSTAYPTPAACPPSSALGINNVWVQLLGGGNYYRTFTRTGGIYQDGAFYFVDIPNGTYNLCVETYPSASRRYCTLQRDDPTRDPYKSDCSRVIVNDQDNLSNRLVINTSRMLGGPTPTPTLTANSQLHVWLHNSRGRNADGRPTVQTLRSRPIVGTGFISDTQLNIPIGRDEAKALIIPCTYSVRYSLSVTVQYPENIIPPNVLPVEAVCGTTTEVDDIEIDIYPQYVAPSIGTIPTPTLTGQRVGIMMNNPGYQNGDRVLVEHINFFDNNMRLINFQEFDDFEISGADAVRILRNEITCIVGRTYIAAVSYKWRPRWDVYRYSRYAYSALYRCIDGTNRIPVDLVSIPPPRPTGNSQCFAQVFECTPQYPGCYRSCNYIWDENLRRCIQTTCGPCAC